MNTPSKVLALPPKPPAAVNTVLLACMGLILSAGSTVTFLSIYSFPENSFMQVTLSLMACFGMSLVAFFLGLRAVMNETKRTQFKHVVDEYTRLTGDKRYIPYLLPVNTKLVASLFSVSILLDLVVPLIVFLGGLNVAV